MLLLTDGGVVEINEEKTMENIFNGAKFGDKFKTRDGQIVVYWHYDTKDPYQMPHWVCFADGSFTHYADDGIYHKGNIHTADLDIVGRWVEPVDEEKLSKLAESERLWYRYENEECGYTIDDNVYVEAFKNGYRKAKEE